MKSRVYYLARIIPTYRIPVLERINHEIGGTLVICYGDGPSGSSLNVLTDESRRKDDDRTRLPTIRIRNYWVNGERALYQDLRPLRRVLKPGDVVLMEESPRTMNLPAFLQFCRRNRIGTVLWGHFSSNDRVPTASHPYDRYRRWLTNQVDACACYSEEIRESLARFVPGKKLFLARNTLDSEAIERRRNELEAEGIDAVRQRLGIAKDTLALVFVGRLTRDKGIDLLMRTAAILATRRNVTVIIVGDGPERTAIETTQSEPGVTVVSVGASTDLDAVAPAVFASDVMVLAGRAGLSVNLALLLGRPVVLGPSPGKFRYHGPEAAYLVPSTNGEIAAARTPESIASSINKVAGDWKRYASGARRFALENLQIADMVAGLVGSIDHARRSQTPTSSPTIHPAGDESHTKVVFQWPSVSPYHAARARAFEQQSTIRDLDVSILASAGTEGRYSWKTGDAGIDVETAFPGRPFETLAPRLLQSEIRTRLAKLKPDIVMTNSYSLPDARAALGYGVTHSIPVVVTVDSTEFDATRVRWRERLKTRILSLFSAAIVAGRPQALYMISLGVPEHKIFQGLDVVDNDHFATAAANEGDAARTNAPYFLYVGRLAPEKNLSTLIAAYSKYRQDAQTTVPWPLTIVGEGPEREALFSFVAEHNIDGISFAGRKEYDELPSIYAKAGCIVLVSLKDTWGLVVNEGMASSLPVIVSSKCGCALDLCVDGKNGFIVNPNDVGEISARMLRLTNMSVAERHQMGRASADLIANWDLDAFVRACDCAIEEAQRSPARTTFPARFVLGCVNVLARRIDSFHTAGY